MDNVFHAIGMAIGAVVAVVLLLFGCLRLFREGSADLLQCGLIVLLILFIADLRESVR